MELKNLSFSDLMEFIKYYKKFQEPISYNPLSGAYTYAEEYFIYPLLIEERNKRLEILEKELSSNIKS
ncbi:MAG: hypothetical protein WC827_03740 [Candidatus Paceibacterota bacterium]|jgi:hypothetical protein